jgi:hypothetical protein
VRRKLSITLKLASSYTCCSSSWSCSIETIVGCELGQRFWPNNSPLCWKWLMHRELEWPVSKATCLYAYLYMVYIHLYKIIEGTSEGRFSYQYVSCLWSKIWGRKCKVLLRVTCQKWSQMPHTTSSSSWIVPKNALGWATDPRKYGHPREGWIPCSLELLSKSTFLHRR